MTITHYSYQIVGGIRRATYTYDFSEASLELRRFIIHQIVGDNEFLARMPEGLFAEDVGGINDFLESTLDQG